jgi:hypothetical protein
MAAVALLLGVLSLGLHTTLADDGIRRERWP